MFCRIEAGWRSAAGASATTSAAAAASTMAVNLTADRAPSARGDHDGDDRQRRPGRVLHRARDPEDERRQARCHGAGRGPLERVRQHRASSASARQVSAITGGSVIPIVSGNAMTGHDSQNAACPRASRRRPPARGASVTRNVAYSSRNVAGDQPGPRLARHAERPRQAEERHDRQVRVVGQPAAGGQRRDGRYGVPWCSSSTPDLATTATSGGVGSLVMSQRVGAASAPARLAATASRAPHARPGPSPRSRRRRCTRPPPRPPTSDQAPVR